MVLIIAMIGLFLIICRIYLLQRGRIYFGGNAKTLFDDSQFVELFKELIISKPLPVVIKYNDIKHDLDYYRASKGLRTYNVSGQRKLTLELIQFLTKVYKNIDVVLYIGSASGHLHNVWASMFPKIKIILIDLRDHNIFLSSIETLTKTRFSYVESQDFYKHSNDFIFLGDNGDIEFPTENEKYSANYYNLTENKMQTLDRQRDREQIQEMVKNNLDPDNDTAVDNIKKLLKMDYKFFIIQEKFTHSMANFFKRLEKQGLRIAFISDIRNIKEEIIDNSVLWNMAQQYMWIKTIEPSYYLMKFRIPFQGIIAIDNIPSHVNEDLILLKKLYNIDYIDEYKRGKMTFLDGEIFMQAWAPMTSTETRLYGTKEDISKPDIQYDERTYTNKFFYFNNIERCWVLHENDYVDKGLGIDYCHDCSLQMHILELYNKKVNEEFDILDIIRIFNQHAYFRTKKDIPPHGVLFNNITYKKYRDLAIKYKPFVGDNLPRNI